MPIGEAAERLEQQGIAASLYTSPSHTEDAPRWRVLCPAIRHRSPSRTQAPNARPPQRTASAAYSHARSWALSQSYYFGSVNHNPSHRVELIDGTPIDQHDDLDAIWIGPGNADAADNKPGDEREIAELVRRILTGEELHTTLCVRSPRAWSAGTSPPIPPPTYCAGSCSPIRPRPATIGGGPGSRRSAAWFTAPAPNSRHRPQSGRNTAAPSQPSPAG